MAFGAFEVHAGDFKAGPGHQYLNGHILMKTEGRWLREKIPLTKVKEVEVASEESVKKMAGAVGWGLAGSFVLGPIALLAGVLAGGNKKKVMFVCSLRDHRSFLATAPHSVFQKLLTSSIKQKMQRHEPIVAAEAPLALGETLEAGARGFQTKVANVL
jgi:hypothetical protein